MIIKGIAHWAKVVGEPQPGYDKTKREWSLDLEIDADTKKLLAKEGLGPKIKLSKDGEYEYLSFKRPEFRKDGTPAKPIRIVDAQKNAWPADTKIGNGSVVNVSFVINETEYNGKKHKKPGIIAIQVLKLVEYEGGEREDFEAYPSDETGAETWGEDSE